MLYSIQNLVAPLLNGSNYLTASEFTVSCDCVGFVGAGKAVGGHKDGNFSDAQ